MAMDIEDISRAPSEESPEQQPQEMIEMPEQTAGEVPGGESEALDSDAALRNRAQDTLMQWRRALSATRQLTSTRNIYSPAITALLAEHKSAEDLAKRAVEKWNALTREVVLDASKSDMDLCSRMLTLIDEQASRSTDPATMSMNQTLSTALNNAVKTIKAFREAAMPVAAYVVATAPSYKTSTGADNSSWMKSFCTKVVTKEMPLTSKGFELATKCIASEFSTAFRAIELRELAALPELAGSRQQTGANPIATAAASQPVQPTVLTAGQHNTQGNATGTARDEGQAANNEASTSRQMRQKPSQSKRSRLNLAWTKVVSKVTAAGRHGLNPQYFCNKVCVRANGDVSDCKVTSDSELSHDEFTCAFTASRLVALKSRVESGDLTADEFEAEREAIINSSCYHWRRLLNSRTPKWEKEWEAIPFSSNTFMLSKELEVMFNFIKEHPFFQDYRSVMEEIERECPIERKGKKQQPATHAAQAGAHAGEFAVAAQGQARQHEDEALRRAVEVAQQAAAAPLFDSFVRKDNGMWVHPGLSLDGSFKEVSYVMLNQTAMQQVEVAPLPKELAAGKGSSALKVDIAELFNKLLTLGGLHLAVKRGLLNLAVRDLLNKSTNLTAAQINYLTKEIKDKLHPLYRPSEDIELGQLAEDDFQAALKFGVDQGSIVERNGKHLVTHSDPHRPSIMLALRGAMQGLEAYDGFIIKGEFKGVEVVWAAACQLGGLPKVLEGVPTVVDGNIIRLMEKCTQKIQAPDTTSLNKMKAQLEVLLKVWGVPPPAAPTQPRVNATVGSSTPGQSGFQGGIGTPMNTLMAAKELARMPAAAVNTRKRDQSRLGLQPPAPSGRPRRDKGKVMGAEYVSDFGDDVELEQE